MPTSPLEVGAGLLQGAARTQTELTESSVNDLTKRKLASDENLSKLAETGISEAGANSRQAAANKSAMDLEKSKEEADFITLTPELRKGAANVTGDNSWLEIPEGHKIRADVYSSLLAHGVESKKMDQPQTFDIEEDGKKYTAEYDPKTRKLRKLTSGSPDPALVKASAAGSPAKMDPNAIQTQIRQDEKTLLAQLGGKGAKGIPGAEPSFLQKITGGKLGGLDDKERAKLATLRDMAQRLKTNYANAKTVYEARGLKAIETTPENMAIIDKLAGITDDQLKPKADGATVRMIAPDGKPWNIKKEKIAEATKHGFKPG